MEPYSVSQRRASRQEVAAVLYQDLLEQALDELAWDSKPASERLAVIEEEGCFWDSLGTWLADPFGFGDESLFDLRDDGENLLFI